MPIGPRLLPKSGTPAATCAPWRKSVSVLKSEKHRTEIRLGENPWISGLEYIPPLRFGGVLGDFPRALATWYHFSGNFHRYVLSFRLGVPIPDPFLKTPPWRRQSGARAQSLGSATPRRYINPILILLRFSRATILCFFRHELPWRVCAQLGARADSGISTS